MKERTSLLTTTDHHRCCVIDPPLRLDLSTVEVENLQHTHNCFHIIYHNQGVDFRVVHPIFSSGKALSIIELYRACHLKKLRRT